MNVSFGVLSKVVSRTIVARWNDHEIIVNNSWGQESLRLLFLAQFSAAALALGDKTRLTIDGNQVDISDKYILLNTGEPIVKGFIDHDGNHHLVTVFAKAGLLRNLFSVYVDGNQIAGDRI